MIQKKKNILRLTISLLLLCILPFDAAYEFSAVQHPEKDPKTVLFIPAFMESAIGAAITNRPPNFNTFNEFLKDALIFKQSSIELTRAYLSFLTEPTVCLAKYVGQNTITIRAPPCYNP
ncbi:MAG: hypothetical protein C4548_01205 [Desulfobacteraceae bacterium]|jgi:hypothetical protein|nr:MAG: hypothetical protein C4548_01205 [Desulfobacteraceae bacterium]